MKIIKISSCFQCAGETPYRNRVIIDCPITTMDKPSYESQVIHENCPLENSIDVEAVRELCNQPFESYRELQSEILAIINAGNNKP